jgi:ubiquinone/menaquinone biosynthesis C-methylase UbiE
MEKFKEVALRRVTQWWGPRGGLAQFHRPTGVGGRLAGWIMSSRPSNVARSRWAARLLDVQPTDRVIEIGCGPGVALAALAAQATHGLVVGVDHSQVMISQARCRNRASVKAGRIRLIQAPVESLTIDDGQFDAALAVNTVGMWPDPPVRLREIARLLRSGGRIALVAQPRRPDATAAISDAVALELVQLLAEAGIEHVRTEMLDLDPPAAWVLGRIGKSHATRQQG